VDAGEVTNRGRRKKMKFPKDLAETSPRAAGEEREREGEREREKKAAYEYSSIKVTAQASSGVITARD
jgi:hypothetical protein